jgi:heme/copper-type cytochrome/quinol oxidase subunit 4
MGGVMAARLFILMAKARGLKVDVHLLLFMDMKSSRDNGQSEVHLLFAMKGRES